MRYVVFGAGGFIGSHVATALLNANHEVVATHRHTQDPKSLTALGADTRMVPDVSLKGIARAFAEQYELYDDRPCDGLVYAIGHCPPGGFEEAIQYSLSELPLEIYEREVGMHQIGVLNVFQACLPLIVDGGSMLFISSAITRLKDN